MTSLTPYLIPKMEANAINSLINDEYRRYSELVEKTKDFDGDKITYDTQVRMSFSIPFAGFVVSYECIVSVYADTVDVEDIEIIPDLEWEKIEREVEEINYYEQVLNKSI